MIMVLCNIPLILKNVYFNFLKDCKICFLEFCYMLFPLYINLIANYCRLNKATPVAICYLFCTMRQLFFETFGRNFDLFWRRALNSNFEVYIYFCIMFMAFFGGAFLICIFQRSFIYNIHKEDRGRRSRGHKILTNFANGCASFFGRPLFRDM